MRLITLVLVGMLGFGSAASADVLVRDSFDSYGTADGTVLGSSSTSGLWISQGNGVNEPRLVNGSLANSGPIGGGQKVSLTNASSATDPADINAARVAVVAGAARTIYYSFNLKVSAYSADPGTNAVIGGFDSETSDKYDGTFNKAGELVTRYFNNKTQLGVVNASGNGAFSGTNYGNAAVFVVASYTIGGTSTLDIFSKTDAIPPLAPTSGTEHLTSTGNSSSAVNNFFLRGTAFAPPAGITVDNIRIGTSWTDVTPEPTGMSLLMLGCTWTLRRRRRSR